jgi:hypothetical protein
VLFHAELEQANAAGDQVWKMPVADPEVLADDVLESRLYLLRERLSEE